MTFLDALKTGKPMRQRTWASGFLVRFDNHSCKLRWLRTDGDMGKRAKLTRSDLLADNWEIVP